MLRVPPCSSTNLSAVHRPTVEALSRCVELITSYPQVVSGSQRNTQWNRPFIHWRVLTESCDDEFGFPLKCPFSNFATPTGRLLGIASTRLYAEPEDFSRHQHRWRVRRHDGRLWSAHCKYERFCLWTTTTCKQHLCIRHRRHQCVWSCQQHRCRPCVRCIWPDSTNARRKCIWPATTGGTRIWRNTADWNRVIWSACRR
jgi:hypothetical protein